MVYICTKFHENILNGIRVMERTREVNGRTDRRTDRWTDGRRARHNTTRLRRAYKKYVTSHSIWSPYWWNIKAPAFTILE